MRPYLYISRRPDGSAKIFEAKLIDDKVVRQPVRYIDKDGIEYTPPPKPPRRVSPNRSNRKPKEKKPPRMVETNRANHIQRQPTASKPKRETRYDCIYLDPSTGDKTTKHLCGGCPGGQIATIFQCDLYGECLPAAWAPTPETEARRCLECHSYSRPVAPPEN